MIFRAVERGEDFGELFMWRNARRWSVHVLQINQRWDFDASRVTTDVFQATFRMNERRRELRHSRVRAFRQSESRSVRLPVGLRAESRERRRSEAWAFGLASSAADGMICRSRSLRRERQLIPFGGGISLIVRLAGLFGAALLFDAPVALFCGMRRSAKAIGAHRESRIQYFLVYGSLDARLFPAR